MVGIATPQHLVVGVKNGDGFRLHFPHEALAVIDK
jgi:hypothetical protein